MGWVIGSKLHRNRLESNLEGSPAIRALFAPFTTAIIGNHYPRRIMSNFRKLRLMSDEEVQSIWDAIWELPPEDRPDVEWQEDVYSEIVDRGLDSHAK